MDDVGKHIFDKNIDEYWMRAALAQADKASQLGEVPIGAIVVQNKKIVGILDSWIVELFKPLSKLSNSMVLNISIL